MNIYFHRKHWSVNNALVFCICFDLVCFSYLWSQTMFITALPFLSLEAQAAFFNKELVQREVKAILSQKATLSCEVADSKTEVKWYKNGKLLTSSKTIHAESKGKSRQLVIDSVEKNDTGEYICEAGSEKLAFNMHVTGKWLDYICGAYH